MRGNGAPSIDKFHFKFIIYIPISEEDDRIQNDIIYERPLEKQGQVNPWDFSKNQIGRRINSCEFMTMQ